MASNKRKKPIRNVRKAYVRDPRVQATTKKGKTTAAYRKGGGLKEVNDQSGIEILADGTKMGTGRTRPISEDEQVRRDFAATEQKKSEAEVGSDLSADRVSELDKQVKSLGKEEKPKRKRTRARSVATTLSATGATGGTGAGSRPAAAVTGEGGSAGVVKPRRTRKRGQNAGGSIGAPEADTTLDTFGGVARTARGEKKKPLPGGRRVLRTKKDRKASQRTAGSRGPSGRNTSNYDPNKTTGPNTSPERKRKRRDKKQGAAATTGSRKKRGSSKIPKRLITGAKKAATGARRKEAAANKVPLNTVGKKDFKDYLYTDVGAAEAIRAFHPTFEQHSADDIMGYVKSTGSSMKAFYDHVVQTHNAENKMVPVGPKGSGMTRSEGKITRWREVERPVLDDAGKPRLNSAGSPVTETTYESSRGYKGHVKVNYRRNGANTHGYRHFEGPDVNAYPISHLEYLSKQIHHWKDKAALEAKETRSLSRERGGATPGAAGAVLAAATGGNGNSEPVPRPPSGRGGRVQVTKDGTTTVTPRPRTYRPAKPPRKH